MTAGEIRRQEQVAAMTADEITQVHIQKWIDAVSDSEWTMIDQAVWEFVNAAIRATKHK